MSGELVTKVSEALSRHMPEKCVKFGLSLIKAATQDWTDHAGSHCPPWTKSWHLLPALP